MANGNENNGSKLPKILFIMVAAFLLVNMCILLSVTAVGRYNCNQIQGLKRFNVASAHRAQTSLPTLSYFKNHPKELQHNLNELDRYIKENRPRSCASVFNPFPS